LNIQAQINRLLAILLHNKDRFQVVYGGAGSGKTYAIAQKVVATLARSKEYERWIIVRKVAKTIRHSVFAIVKDFIIEWGLYEDFYIRESDHYIQNKKTGNDAIFLGLDDVEKLKSIKEPTKIWIEEASEIAQSDLIQLNLRLRGKTKTTKQMILSFNPISSMHWLKAYFFDNPKKNVFISHTTYRDNAFLDEEYKQELEDLKDIDYPYYCIYCLGEWGMIGNLAFTNIVIEEFDKKLEDYDTILYGMDYGFNHANAFELLGMQDEEIYLHDELYRKKITNQQFITEMEPMKKQYKLENKIINADSASPAYIKEFRDSGYTQIKGAEKGDGSVIAGVNWLKRRTLHIHRTRCPHAAAEFANAKYKEDKDGNLKEELVPFNDDTIAAARYAVEPLWKGKQIPDILVPIPR